MNFIPLEITIKFADIFKNVNFFDRKRIYTRVSLKGSHQISTQKTHVDEHNGSKPFWCFKMKFEVEESKMHENSCTLEFQVRCSKTLGDKDIGFIDLPVKKLFDGGQKYPTDVACAVATRSGKLKGVLYLTYKFGEIIRFGPVPSAPPYSLLEGGFPAGTTPVAPSAPPYIGEDSW